LGVGPLNFEESRGFESEDFVFWFDVKQIRLGRKTMLSSVHVHA